MTNDRALNRLDNCPPTELEILQERLDSYKDEAAQFDKLSLREVPEEIIDDSQAGEVTDHIKCLKALSSEIATIHKREKKPFWDCGKAADKWKADYLFKIDNLISDASLPVINWNRKKEAEERKRQLEIAEKARIDAEALAEEAAQHSEAGIEDTAAELMDAAVQEETKADMISNNLAQGGIVGRSRGDFSSSSNRKPWVGVLDSRAALDMDALRQYFTEDDINKAIRKAVRDGVRDIRGVNIYQDEKLTVR